MALLRSLSLKDEVFRAFPQNRVRLDEDVVMTKVAVVGAGYWGKNLVRNFAQLGVLDTVCDYNPLALQYVQEHYPAIKTTREFSGVLRDRNIQAIVVASPAEQHYPMAREALLAGKDVFVEKPLALNIEDGTELVQLAHKNGAILMVGHILEYHPAIIRLKEIINQGELGKINYIYSTRLNLGKIRTEENILWSFAPHDISVILSLLGEKPLEVSVHGESYLNAGVADVTITALCFANSVRAHIFVSWLHPYKEQKLVIIGDRKMVVFDDVKPQEKLILYNHTIDWINRQPIPRKENAEVVEVHIEEPLALECQHFLVCLATRQEPRTNGAKGLAVLEVLTACQRSLEKSGANVVLERKTKDYFVHETSIVEEPSLIGSGTKIWHFSHVMPETVIGRNCSVGQNVFVGRGVRLGDNVKIQNNVSVYEGVTLEDDVFCGPSMVFTNVINPRSQVSRKHEFRSTLVRQGASIGANATIVCGHVIGRYAFVGAGALVTKDVPDYALVYGVPATLQGWMCECGVRLEVAIDWCGEAVCCACGKKYQRQDNAISRIG
jgi:UDP-2-acetamido-3-amino-2,3-dideoxy-glucuronate N-acetyltransferase